MNDPFDSLATAVSELPAEYATVIIPFLALAFELYVPGVVVPAPLRRDISALLESLGPSARTAYPEARIALLRRFEAAGLSVEFVRSIAPATPALRPRSPSRIVPSTCLVG